MTTRRILAFTAGAEFVTGLALFLNPRLVVELLFGANVSDVAVLLGRCFGIALIAIGLACWPRRREREAEAIVPMIVYNALIVLVLAYAGAGALAGLLLWPVVALHAILALLLIWAWRKDET
jgi:hypothetical protein